MTSSTELLTILGVTIAVIIALFLILREVTLWYFKINELIRNQKTTNDLLQKMYILQGGKADDPSKVNQTNEINEDDLKSYDTVFVKTLGGGDKHYMSFGEWKKNCEDENYRKNHVILSVTRASI
jgi:hypothetical protein